ncbi:YcgL domain-containing protein [Psychrobacter frigidicola]|uniref:YcgL domain-containing protein ES754_04960 n=1 Tax=Psychrobacter frigidicola TaxID=45611 RepID=A0A5C7A6F7_9GAMM|nr:YcgL domain-containing protein [Psychrobacter frigidicola]TXD98280.1 YcgL domain-containing protein [Psychrobacter frigidicola]
MHCDIYKFPKHNDMYVYIARPDYPDDTDEIKDWLSVLPKDFRSTLGVSKFVLHLDLSTTPTLARVDKDEVITKLKSQGYFVQMPPQDVMRRQAELRALDAQDNKYD